MSLNERKEQFLSKLTESLTDEETRIKIQYDVVYLFLMAVAVFMTLLNLLTQKGALTIATAVFALLCLVDFVLAKVLPGKGLRISAGLFMAEIIALFTFFLVSGKPEGFSAIWMCMLPACGMLLFGRMPALALCLIMLGIQVFFLQIPVGQRFLQYEYTETFRNRFPIVFLASMLLSYFLETIRVVTQQELEKMRRQYAELYSHDTLTGALNRFGFTDMVQQSKPGARQTLLLLDIDYFKLINEEYGFEAGDAVLKRVVREMSRILGVEVCRWGGEEFVAWFPTGIASREMAQAMLYTISTTAIEIGNGRKVQVTASIGGVETTDRESIENLIGRAGICLATAKENGRNQVVWES